MTVSTLEDLLEAVQTAVAAISGVQYAPPNPPEQAADFPFAVTYPATFDSQINTPEDYRTLYDIRVELHVARKDLPEDVAILLPYAETFLTALHKVVRDNAVACERITGTFGALEWGGVETIGYVWTIVRAKLRTTIT